MTRRLMLSLAFGSCLVLASTALAQGPGGPGGGGPGGGGRGGFPGMGGPGGLGGMQTSPIMLLASPEVQEELKLTDEQKKQLEELRTELMSRRGQRGQANAQPADPAAPQGGRPATAKTAQRGQPANAQAGGGQNGQGDGGQGGPGGQGGQPGGRPDFAAIMEQIQKAMKDAETKLAKILKPVQRTRLTQIALRMEGPFAIANKPEIATRLRVTDEQQEQIAMVMADYQAGQQELGQARRDMFTQLRDSGGMQRGTPLSKENQAKMDSMQKENETFKGKAELAIGKALTKKQRTAWEGMLGAPFDTTKITFGGGRGGQGGRGGPGATPAAAAAAAAAAATPETTKAAAETTPAKKSLRDRRAGTVAEPTSDNP